MARFRHRRGYGVHSPFAFAFITGVVYEQSPYYAYASLASLHPWWVRWSGGYPLKCRRLLFRLANYVHPDRVLLVGAGAEEQAYVKAAVPRAEVLCTRETAEPQQADFVFLGHEQLSYAPSLLPAMPSKAMMVLEGIHEKPEALALWRTLQESDFTGVSFDLFTYGILFFNHHIHKQHYIVNF